MFHLRDAWRIYAAVLAGTIGAPSAASAATGELMQIDAIVRKAIDEKSIPGAAVAVEERGEITFSHAYGVADLKAQAPVRTTTTFRLGSISKMITALAIMRLVDERRLNLDAPVARLLSDHPQASLLPKSVTVRRLLNHTAGLSDIPEEELKAYIAKGGAIPDSAFTATLARPPVHEPGTEWSYVNIGYKLLSQIVERASGKGFGRYMVEQLSPALGVRSLRLCGSDDVRWAKGYEPKEGWFRPEAAYTVAGLLGEGGLCASAEDLVKLPNALVQGKWISPSGLVSMLRPTRLKNGAIADYGLGVRRGLLGSTALWGHTGSGLSGGWAALAYYPEKRLTVVVLANGSGGPDDAITLQAQIGAVLLNEKSLRDVKLEASVLKAVSGGYSSGADEQVCYQPGPKGLERRLTGSEKPPRPLLYQGEGIFARSDYPLDRLVFQIERGRSVAHRVYYDGYFAELLKPTSKLSCAEHRSKTR